MNSLKSKFAKVFFEDLKKAKSLEDEVREGDIKKITGLRKAKNDFYEKYSGRASLGRKNLTSFCHITLNLHNTLKKKGKYMRSLNEPQFHLSAYASMAIHEILDDKNSKELFDTINLLTYMENNSYLHFNYYKEKEKGAMPLPNALLAIAYSLKGRDGVAERINKTIYERFDHIDGLFTGKYPNHWTRLNSAMAISNALLGRKEEAKQMINNLEDKVGLNDKGLIYFSDRKKIIHLGANALYGIACFAAGYDEKALSLVRNLQLYTHELVNKHKIINSNIYKYIGLYPESETSDRVTTTTNALMQSLMLIAGTITQPLALEQKYGHILELDKGNYAFKYEFDMDRAYDRTLVKYGLDSREERKAQSILLKHHPNVRYELIRTKKYQRFIKKH